MPHNCRTFWGEIADELSYVIWEQSVMAGGVSGWGSAYTEPMAYSACVTLLDQLNAALGTDPEGAPNLLTYEPGYFPPGEVASLALLMVEALHFDRYDDTPGQMDRHNRMGFPWVETNAGNVPNNHKPDLEGLRRRIRDVLELGRTPDPRPVEINPQPQMVPMGMPHGTPEEGAEGPPHGRSKRAKVPIRPSWRRRNGDGGGSSR